MVQDEAHPRVGGGRSVSRGGALSRSAEAGRFGEEIRALEVVVGRGRRGPAGARTRTRTRTGQWKWVRERRMSEVLEARV